MKVVALNGSPRLIGNTSTAVNLVLDELEKDGIEVEHIQVYETEVIPCNDCGSCDIRGDGRCINENDKVNEYLEKMLAADGILLASPTYFGSMTAQLKMILERIGLCSVTAGNQLKRKVGASIAVHADSGASRTFSELTGFMMENGLTVCGVPAILRGEKPSDLASDERQIRILKELGKEMSWLLHQMKK